MGILCAVSTDEDVLQCCYDVCAGTLYRDEFVHHVVVGVIHCWIAIIAVNRRAHCLFFGVAC